MFKLPSAYEYWLNQVVQGNLSSGGLMRSLILAFVNQTKNVIFSSISEILPFALSVGGAILVVTLGWRLFRNFTRG